MSDKLTEKQLEDLQRYRGSYRLEPQRDVKRMISEASNPPYNATEDIPLEMRQGSIDQMYDRYAEANPVHGQWLKLKRLMGRTLAGGNEK